MAGKKYLKAARDGDPAEGGNVRSRHGDKVDSILEDWPG